MEERIFRVKRDGSYREYTVAVSERATVLDVLLYIHRHIDRGLAFRYACRQGMCGTCGLRVNGVERLACSTLVSAIPGRKVVVEPLRNLGVIKDLAVDFGAFFWSWSGIQPQFAPRTEGANLAVIPPSSPERREIDGHRECISCALCYSSCDVVARNRQYLGPAALNRAYCLVLDVRDSKRGERLRSVAGMSGSFGCHSLMTCVEVCPKDLKPALAIEGLRRQLAREAFSALRGILGAGTTGS